MDYFFNPGGIAVIGATQNPNKGGNAIIRNLITGFTGGIYPVNPRYSEINGLKCYPSVLDVPDPVDLAIVFIPAGLVPDAIAECAERGIRGVMIESGGFAETGENGKALQDKTLKIAKDKGVRLWGPNCMGLVDSKSRHVFSFVSPNIWDFGLKTGGVSLIVQSGMLSGVFLIDNMTHGFMGASKVCSIGNKMDVEESELLSYLIDDPETKSIGLYLESIKNGRRFIDVCRRSTKPIVILRGGKSAKGAKAAMSHTASLSGDGAVLSGALAQVGVVEADDFRQMIELSQTLSIVSKPAEEACGRIAILTYSGGAGIVSTDFMDTLGLEVADFAPGTIEALKKVFPDWMPVSNPVDLWPAVEKNGAGVAYGEALKAVCADKDVDAVFIHCFVGGFGLTPDIETLAATSKSAGKQLFCWLLGDSEGAKELHEYATSLGIPVYRELHRAVECISAVYNSNRRHILQETVSASQIQLPDDARTILKEEKGVLDEYQSKRILSSVEIPVVEESVVEN